MYATLVHKLKNLIGYFYTALPWIRGPRVLEASFGTGYLLTQCAGQFETYSVDLNQRLANIAKDNL